VDGELYASHRDVRKQIIAGSKDESIKIICNRFVTREGLDLPWLSVGILATVFSSVSPLPAGET
jgi:superfamily II DNA or RNA helicase